MRIDNFTCPISFFVVNETNNKLVTSTGTYTITTGNYNANTLRTALASVMSGYTITYDSTQNKLTFSRTSAFTFYSTSTCFKLLGFGEDEDHASSSNSLTSDYVVNLSGTSLIYIDIPNITTRNISAKNNGGFTTIVKSIVNKVSYGSVLAYTNDTGSSIVLGEKYISYFQVRLLDDDYNLLDLSGQYFTLTIELSYEPNGQPVYESGSLLENVIRQQEQVKNSLNLK